MLACWRRWVMREVEGGSQAGQSAESSQEEGGRRRLYRSWSLRLARSDSVSAALAPRQKGAATGVMQAAFTSQLHRQAATLAVREGACDFHLRDDGSSSHPLWSCAVRLATRVGGRRCRVITSDDAARSASAGSAMDSGHSIPVRPQMLSQRREQCPRKFLSPA